MKKTSKLFFYYLIFMLFFFCKNRSANNRHIENIKPDENTFKELKLPFSSSHIKFKKDSLGYSIIDSTSYVNSNKIKPNLTFHTTQIIPIGKLTTVNYTAYVYGFGVIGEENLEPILVLKTFDLNNKLLDSLELQKKMAWDYELERQFNITKSKKITINEKLITYKLESPEENGTEKNTLLKYQLQPSGKIIEE